MQDRVKVQFVFPKSILDAVDRAAGRRKRSRFVAQATVEKLEKLAFEKAADTAFGAWADDEYPDLQTDEDMEVFLANIRRGTNLRIWGLSHE
ncbi:MAG: hypothetical protein AB1566_14340 [Chloroflexota bacterium]